MNEVEEIKEKIDIVDFIGGYLNLQKAGQNYKGLCPFHNEKTPSFMVSPERQIFKCFGCDVGGDVFTFLMQMENLDFKETLEILAEKTGVQLKKKQNWQDKQFSGDYSRIGYDPSSRVESPTISKKRLYDINLLATKIFHKILLEHPSGKGALEYLIKKRGLTKETIDKFMIGYAPQKNILSSFFAKRNISASESRSAGSPEKFSHRIIFPIMDIMGNIVGFTGRAMSDEQMPKYFNTPETVIFHKNKLLYGLNLAKQEIRAKQQVILVEGQMDVILSCQAGIKNVVASSGTSLTSEQIKILSRYDAEIILAYDQDEAGIRAAQRAAELALSNNLGVKIISWKSRHKDPGEIIADSAEKWRKISEESVPYIEWLFKILAVKYDPGDISGKRQIAQKILPVLQIINNEIEKSHWIKKVAQYLDTREQNIIDALYKLKKTSIRPARENNNQALDSKEAKKGITPDEELIVLMAANKKLWDKYHKIIGADYFISKKAKSIYRKLEKGYSKIKDKDLENWIFELERFYDFNDLERLERAILSIIEKSKERAKETLKSKFADSIKKAEEGGDRDKIKKLLKEFQVSINKIK